jgi:hypothetical protein
MNASSVLGGDPASWPAGKPTSLVSRLRPAKPLPLSRAERIRRFGVDCGDGLTWAAGWVPGGEYTKQLIVKNVSKTVVRLKYKLPESKFFSMAFPEMIQLTPGLSMTLQVSARRDVVEGFWLPEPCLCMRTSTLRSSSNHRLSSAAQRSAAPAAPAAPAAAAAPAARCCALLRARSSSRISAAARRGSLHVPVRPCALSSAR